MDTNLPYHIWHKDGGYQELLEVLIEKYKSKRDEVARELPERISDIQYLLGQLGQPMYYGHNSHPLECLIFHMASDKENMDKVRKLIQNRSLNTYNKEIQVAKGDNEEDEDEEFFTPASTKLINARKEILRYSLLRSKKRLALQQQLTSRRSSEIILERRKFIDKSKCFKLIGANVISTRPISSAVFSHSCDNIVTGSWSGDVTVLNRNMELIGTMNAHSGKVGTAKWTPDDKLIISGGEDGLVNICNENLSDVKLMFEGHQNRITSLDIHPSGSYLATASFDLTWKLWDIGRGTELLQQEGHSEGLYCIAFQNDGSLISTAGSDKTVLVWDLRSGKSVLNLEGHAKSVYCMDWSTDGYTVATGGGDGFVYAWDLRNHGSAVRKIAAHNSIVTSLRFDKDRDFALISAGYDKKINLYSKDSYMKIFSLEGHADKILTVDIDNMTNTIISGGWDRTLKAWCR